ncbi:MAG: hypothetical protein V3U29_01485 [Phycisphaeraceae bacterium]
MIEFLKENDWVLLLVGVSLVTVWLLSRLAKRSRRQAQTPTLSPQEHVERARQIRGVRGDLDELMVEVEQLAKRLGAQLDAKTIYLEKLLDRAERTAEQLRQLTDQDAAPSGSPSAAASEAPLDDPLARSVYSLADQGLDPLAIARKIGEHVGKVELILALRKVQ